MKVVRVETVQEAMELLIDQPYDEASKIYRNLYVYRGIPNIDFKLITSLRRNCGKKQKELEQHILDNFSKYAEHEAPSMLTSIWKRMILGQHIPDLKKQLPEEYRKVLDDANSSYTLTKQTATVQVFASCIGILVHGRETWLLRKPS